MKAEKHVRGKEEYRVEPGTIEGMACFYLILYYEYLVLGTGEEGQERECLAWYPTEKEAVKHKECLEHGCCVDCMAPDDVCKCGKEEEYPF